MSKFAFQLFVLVLSATAILRGPQDGEAAPGEERAPWRILVTNDDGIDSPALVELVAALGEHAEVVVCAPASNRSGSSQSIAALGRPMTMEEVTVVGAQQAVAVGGTPADAVCYGIVELGRERPFDLVVSGINEGPNVGEVSHYSGTVGAAMEGAYRGIPAIAVSQGGRGADYSFAAGFTARFAWQLKQNGTRAGVVYTINVPTGAVDKLKGVAARPMGGSFVTTQGYSHSGARVPSGSVLSGIRYEREGPAGSDTAAYLEGFVTVTPLQFDWTDRAALAELADWELTLE